MTVLIRSRHLVKVRERLRSGIFLNLVLHLLQNMLHQNIICPVHYIPYKNIIMFAVSLERNVTFKIQLSWCHVGLVFWWLALPERKSSTLEKIYFSALLPRICQLFPLGHHSQPQLVISTLFFFN